MNPPGKYLFLADMAGMTGAAFSSYTSRWMILVSASWRGMSCQNKTQCLIMQHTTSKITRHKTMSFLKLKAQRHLMCKYSKVLKYK